RAGLAIAEGMAELRAEGLPVDVRIGIETGEAIVAVGASGPQIGEAVTGDVVNTTSRLQSAAPVNGVLVGDAAYRATHRAIVYEEHEPVTAKGKADPLVVWVAREARGRLGSELTRTHATPYVDREPERAELR